MQKKSLRWIPAALVPAVVVAGTVLIPATADAAPRLAEKSPQELLEFVADSSGAAYSGTVEQRSDIGLPDPSSLGSLPSNSDSPVSMALGLLTGSQEARVFVGGEDTARVQVMDTLTEQDFIRNKNEAWTYDSDSKDVTHVTLENGAAPEAMTNTTPAALAKQFVDTLKPTTTVTTTDNATVAGRSAYQLVMTPKTDSTLVDSVILAVDSETGVPLSVDVFAKGQKKVAFAVGFSSVDFSAPDASRFEFTPPAGAKVTDKTIDGEKAHNRMTKKHDAMKNAEARGDAKPGAKGRPTVTGTGWDSIVEIDNVGEAMANAGSESAALDALLTPVAGGNALQTSLVSVLLTDDGRMFAGAVGMDQLEAAAAR